ncbi:hypothetical protein SAMN06265373_105120 [Shimia sagamensis]|uniref:Uncharacterized protein n=1 Tax=Shimia sagamensis TaxID=1566352 RepID=A0ABY1P3Q9_9RHOB|nr:hypothetical protein SAMN06265373_105120 [Shimia sagamensis]
MFLMFMAGGFFVSKLLPSRLSDTDLHLFPPLGFHPKLPVMGVDGIKSALADRKWTQGESHLLLAAHSWLQRRSKTEVRATALL